MEIYFRTGDLSIEQGNFFERTSISWICTKQMFLIDINYPLHVVHNFFVDNVDNSVNNLIFNENPSVCGVDNCNCRYTQIVNKYMGSDC